MIFFSFAEKIIRFDKIAGYIFFSSLGNKEDFEELKALNIFLFI